MIKLVLSTFIAASSISIAYAADEAPAATEVIIPQELIEYEKTCISADKTPITGRTCFVAASMYDEEKSSYYSPFT